ncbi:MAG: hypothetical protein M1836_002795 [Candelina mexicana]|nr:MAG: hypothetical protein M1836_002795 [Candelina mexicana]
MALVGPNDAVMSESYQQSPLPQQQQQQQQQPNPSTMISKVSKVSQPSSLQSIGKQRLFLSSPLSNDSIKASARPMPSKQQAQTKKQKQKRWRKMKIQRKAAERALNPKPRAIDLM